MFCVRILLSLLTHLRLLSIIPLSLLISLGIINSYFVRAAEENLSRSQGSSSRKISSTQASSLANGVYLYGRSPEPETMGQEYLVFQVQKGEVMGAFYMPRSEFNCFSGSLDNRQLNLSIVDPHDGIKYNYAISLQAVSPVATNSRRASEVTLEGYHRLGNLSENDRRILNACFPSN